MAKGKKTGGRRAGTPNKANAEIKMLAGQHSQAAVERLAWLMVNAESEAAQVGAAKELLDRAHGKAPQAHIGDGDCPIEVVARLAWLKPVTS